MNFRTRKKNGFYFPAEFVVTLSCWSRQSELLSLFPLHCSMNPIKMRTLYLMMVCGINCYSKLCKICSVSLFLFIFEMIFVVVSNQTCAKLGNVFSLPVSLLLLSLNIE